MKEKIVLAYSGGLDTSVAIKWLKEKYDYDVVTLTVDVGQADDLEEITKKSKLVGAVGHHTIDAKNEFVKDYIFPAIKANGLYEWKYPISTALARPLIAKKLVEIAHKENATVEIWAVPTVVANIRKRQNASGIIHNEPTPKARSQQKRSK